MSYYVLTPDGQRYGPADIPTLVKWVEEGRILASTTLESAITGERIQASQLQGLQFGTTFASPPGGSAFPQPPSANQPQVFANYQRGPVYGGDLGSSDLTLAWVFASIGLVFCFVGGVCSGCSVMGIVFPVLGLVFSNRAAAKGNPNANGARILSIIALVLQVLSLLLFFGILGLGAFR